MKKNILVYGFMLAVLLFTAKASATIRYVKTGSAGTAPYTSWATASNDLQVVINQCIAGDEIWIATGTYKPNRRADALTVITATDRNDAFVLKNAVKIYGGFTGVETLLSQRNSTANLVTLSGDIGTAGVTTDNCYHVVIIANTASTTTLMDGVSIVSGNANAAALVPSITVNTFSINPRFGGGMYKVSSAADITDCRFRRNDASLSGAGIYETLSSSVSVYTNCSIVQNGSADDGGGMYIVTSSCIYQSCSFTLNDAADKGAGLYISGTGSPAFTSCTISSNDAVGEGGAAYLTGSGSPSFDNCTIITNTTGSNGGGIYNEASSLQITSSDIEQNVAVGNGGGIYNTTSSPVLNSNSIADNEAGNNGGGIFNTATTNNITGGSITGNIAGNHGGGIYNTTSSGGNIISVKILSNTATRGGGMYNSSSSPLVSGCALYNNTASASGGAAYNFNSDTTEFDNCAFNSNTANTSGGAIYFNGGTAPGVKSCSFRGNQATSGGGMYVSGSDVTFVNCLVSGNLAANGGGMFLGTTNPVFINCTVVANRATTAGGGIILSFGVSIILRNSIVWSNIAPSGNNMTGGGTITASYSNVEGGAAGTGNINASSLFIAPEPAASAPTLAGNYRVQKCSPVINAGNNAFIPAGITEDIAGDNRINYAIVDMGAYEKTLAVKAPSGIIYVDHAKNGDGSQWDKAIPSLADALLTAKYNAAITEIWVAKGTYYPGYNATNLASLVCNSANRYNSFVLVNNVKVYGGFVNGAATLAERAPQNNLTILSGDIDGDNTSAGNAYHVVISAGSVGTAALDGFTITAGNADYSGNTVTVNGITVTSFYGGGMGISLSAPAINNCILEANHGDHGGAISVLSGSPVFNRCIIRNNTAKFFGGALDHYVIGPPSFAVFNNCLITGNRSEQYGGAFVNTYPSVITLNNSTVAGNFALVQGGGLWSNGAASEIFTNSILWGNKVGATANNIFTVSGTVNATYCDIEGGYAGIGNINTNPLFINPQPASAAPTAAGDYHLQKCSPVINVGSNAIIPISITKDLDSSSRISLLTVDMGAYEKHLAKPDVSGIVYVDSSNTAGAGDGSSWPKAVTELADALKEAKTNTDVKEIWVAKGTYKPIYNASDTYLNSICGTTDRDASFVLVPDVKIYGGFAGGETDTSGRSFVTNETIMSGDIGVANDNTDNCYHVVISSGAAGSGALDGVSVTKGNANGAGAITINGNSFNRNYAPGIYNKSSSPAIIHCNISGNLATGSGGGIGNSSSSPVITDCFISANAASFGGGIENLNSSSPVITSCIITGNTVTFSGGGIFNGSGCSPFLTNCIISGNAAATDGGGIYIGSSSSSSIINCTIAANKAAGYDGAVYNFSSPLTVKNSIIWGNTAPMTVFPGSGSTVTYTLIEGGHAGTGNINLDPLYVSPQTAAAAPTILGDYHLQACSPALNLGDNSLVPGGLTKDRDSLDRVKFTTVDMGAYEKQDVDLSNTTWKGINTNWNNKINWCGGYIPTDTTNVNVPLTINKPLIGAGYDNQVKNISFANGSSIGIAATSKFTINGTYSNLGSTITNNGDWVMAGNAASQTFPGTLATVSAMKNLEVNNPSGLKFDKSFQLTGTLTPTAGNINVDNATITLNSDAGSTARVAAVPSGVAFSYTGSGKFEIERYIPAHRAWRLITAPISTVTNLTISQAWQEGVSNANRLAPVNPAPGFGTTITKSTTYNASDGYDQGSTNNTSIRYYNGSNWNGVPSKTIGTTPGANDGLINDQLGYMLFVRGNRAIQVAGTGVTATVTTLRPKGQIKVGPQTITCAGWTVIGNPYASPINFHQIVLDNPGLPDAFYVWDANLAGSYNVGGWVSYGSYNGGSQTYTVAPLLSGSTFANNKGDISSGSAFMVNYTGTITINENHKSTLGDNVLLRPVRQLSMNLFVVNADSTESLNDGVAIVMDASPGAANAEKNTNFTENLAIAFNNKRYAIQNRQRPHFNDTIFMYTGQMKQRNYVLEIKAAELNMPNRMKAYLEDTYLHQYTTVALEGSTRYAFAVNADSASLSASRFRLLFKKSTRFGPVRAAAKGTDIEVQWAMEEISGLEKFEIERSGNGIDFMLVQNPSTNRNQQPLLQNKWLDISPAAGTYFYRFKATCIDGEVLYSDIAKAVIVKNNEGIYVYPNPVTGNSLQLRMNKQLAGQYIATLINQQGLKIFTQQWEHSESFVTRVLQLPAMTAAGIYQLEIIKPGGKNEVIVVEVQR